MASAPRFLVGTSGDNYPEWKGVFYPSDLAASKMLPYYAERFPTVEINYTFYRLPKSQTVNGWGAGTPPRLSLRLTGRTTAPPADHPLPAPARRRGPRPLLLQHGAAARAQARAAALPAPAALPARLGPSRGRARGDSPRAWRRVRVPP